MNPPQVPSGPAKGEGGEAVEIEEEDEQGKKKGTRNSPQAEGAAGDQRIEQLSGGTPERVGGHTVDRL